MEGMLRLVCAGILRLFVCMTTYTLSNTNSSGRISSSDSYTITQCDFINLGSTGYSGGAIYVTGTNLLIYSSTFKSCVAYEGAAIYSGGTYFLIQTSCALDCYASFEGQFISSYASSTNISSISYSRCSNSSLQGQYHSIDLRQGTQILNTVNASNNYLSTGGSAAEIVTPTSFSASYINFFNCTKGGYYAVLILYSCVTGTFTYGNIVSNVGTTIVYGCSSWTFSYFIFANNSGTLFNSPTVIHSYISHVGTTGTVYTSDISMISYPTSTYSMKWFSCKLFPAVASPYFSKSTPSALIGAPALPILFTLMEIG